MTVHYFRMLINIAKIVYHVLENSGQGVTNEIIIN